MNEEGPPQPSHRSPFRPFADVSQLMLFQCLQRPHSTWAASNVLIASLCERARCGSIDVTPTSSAECKVTATQGTAADTKQPKYLRIGECKTAEIAGPAQQGHTSFIAIMCSDAIVNCVSKPRRVSCSSASCRVAFCLGVTSVHLCSSTVRQANTLPWMGNNADGGVKQALSHSALRCSHCSSGSCQQFMTAPDVVL